VTDFFAFRTMIASRFIQVVFALGLAGIVVMFLGAAANDRVLLGLLLLVFGALYWRVLCEVFIVFFRMNDTLRAIKEDTASLSPALATIGLAPDQADRDRQLTPVGGDSSGASAEPDNEA
jgi:hypothetical protein